MEVKRFLQRKVLLYKEGPIVDANIIHASCSTRKNNQRYFGMKSHIGVDSQSGLVHSVDANSAKAGDSHVIADLLHSKEDDAYGNIAYRSQALSLKAIDPREPISPQYKTNNR